MGSGQNIVYIILFLVVVFFLVGFCLIFYGCYYVVCMQLKKRGKVFKFNEKFNEKKGLIKVGIFYLIIFLDFIGIGILMSKLG